MVLTHLLRAAAAAFALCVLAACGGEARDLPVADIDCRTGLYVSGDGNALALTPTSSGGYRWRMSQGGWMGWINTRGLALARQAGAEVTQPAFPTP